MDSHFINWNSSLIVMGRLKYVARAGTCNIRAEMHQTAISSLM